MRIGVNALYLVPGGVGGTEIYLRSLLAALAEADGANEYVVFTNRETGADLVPARANFRYAPQPVNGGNRPARILYEQFRLPLRGLDVLFNPGFTAPLATCVPQVTVVHDLQHKRHPEHFRWFDLPAWRFLVWGAVHRSRRIVAVSEATKADLLRYYHLRESRICVIPHGVDPSFFGLPRAPEPMILCVSTLHPHKNIDRLVRVFARFHGRHPDYRLVLAGIRGLHTDAIEREVAQSSAREAIEITGWIPRDDLYRLFTRAAMFIYPSTFEGFGMPILEALAADVPTACSDVEPIKSIVGSAAWTFPPHDDGAMLAAMENLAHEVLPAQRGPERARQFSWRAAARATVDLLTEAAGARPMA